MFSQFSIQASLVNKNRVHVSPLVCAMTTCRGAAAVIHELTDRPPSVAVCRRAKVVPLWMDGGKTHEITEAVERDWSAVFRGLYHFAEEVLAAVEPRKSSGRHAQKVRDDLHACRDNVRMIWSAA
ncbi:hypothetical protein NG895_15645 [Aeoliella sp. ICT_H6.2]|uniref:Uncharacterized protein n=1 Tax=Aeoliella straminimaris TaxID=2954799 RepID=A0A9X2FAL6_9BACT|nr:hypothetical protein [Aeoliella straminimaris]MCO6045345.1 hypothetical protein [Aeoliella straminimaris]